MSRDVYDHEWDHFEPPTRPQVVQDAINRGLHPFRWDGKWDASYYDDEVEGLIPYYRTFFVEANGITVEISVHMDPLINYGGNKIDNVVMALRIEHAFRYRAIVTRGEHIILGEN